MSAPLLEVENLHVSFGYGANEKAAVRGLSMSIGRGKTVALVGESGSGKSLSTRAVLKLTPPGARITADTIVFDGRDIRRYSEHQMGAIRGKQIGLVFQEPMTSLNPVLTVGRQITEVLRRHFTMSRKQARTRARELLGMVEIPDPDRCSKQYPHELSGGMQQRAMIAIAIAAQPQLLIADEPTTALDVTLQAQVLDLLSRLQADLGMAMLFISHDLSVVAGVADEVNVMYAGRVVERASAGTLFHHARHPYTQGLLRIVKDLDSPSTVDLAPIPGSPPGIGELPPGCPFAPRCPWVVDRCRTDLPEPRSVGPSHLASCHRAHENLERAAS